jgi:hypothetical protein
MVNEKQSFPKIAEKNWWILREQFKKSIPTVVDAIYLKTLLDLQSEKSATSNYIYPLKQMKLLDENGKPTQRARDWRMDEKYSEVCNQILIEVYPTQLLELFPDDKNDRKKIESWFMSNSDVGTSAAQQMAAAYILLKKATIENTSSDVKPEKKTNSPKKIITPSVNASTQDKKSPAINNTISLESNPTIHIDLQIYISPDASSQQIENIFANIKKYFYKDTEQ